MVSTKKPQNSKKKFYMEVVQKAKLDIPPKLASAIIDVILQKRVYDRVSQTDINKSDMYKIEKDIVTDVKKKEVWDTLLISFAMRIFTIVSSILGLIRMCLEISKYIRKLRERGQTKNPSGNGKNNKGNGPNNNASRLTRNLQSSVNLIHEMAKHGGVISFPGTANPTAHPTVRGPPVQQAVPTQVLLEEVVQRLVNQSIQRHYETPTREQPQQRAPSILSPVPNVPGQIPRPSL